MGFKYHPPTRCSCSVCEKLQKEDTSVAIIDTYAGKASSANGYPFHNWYNFVLGYTPSFPEYVLNRENIIGRSNKVVLDPFGGSGTTQLVCKLHGIESYGVDANDFMVFAAQQKLNWTISTLQIQHDFRCVSDRFCNLASKVDWDNATLVSDLANKGRPDALDKRYISDKPLLKIKLLRQAIDERSVNEEVHDILMFAVSAILVPVSNIKYGPGFGVGKIKDDVDVFSAFSQKVHEIIRDLSQVSTEQKETPATTILGDSRRLSEYLEAESVDLIITSPPYPGDHEYTKHSKLEIIFQGYASDTKSFRTIKQRMIRGSTTNIYKTDNERRYVDNIQSINEVTTLIDERLKADGASSGFEKLYTKLVWEYFGGMFQALKECYTVLKPGGKIALLVSDSHAFKMVHIQTAELLRLVGEKAGFVNPEIELWQNKPSTSHKYQLRENILYLQKPN